MFIPYRDNLSFNGTPVLTIAVIAINVLIFAMWQGGSNASVEKMVLYSAVPYEITHPGKQCVPVPPNGFRCDAEKKMEQDYGVSFPHTAVTMLTSMFMHGSWLHLIGNMIMLAACGIALELALGPIAFALFYLLGGLGAELGHMLWETGSPVPMLGASGAISAVLAGFLLLFPAAKLRTFVLALVIPMFLWVRAYVLIAAWLALQFVAVYAMNGADTSVGGGVAYFAHFGGFLTGMLLILLVTDREFIEQQRLHARLCSGDVILVDPDLLAEETAATQAAQSTTGATPQADAAGLSAAPPPAASTHVDPFAPPQANAPAPPPSSYRPAT